MTWYLTYEPEIYQRIMFAVIVDNRTNIPAIKSAYGVAIDAYVSGQILLVLPDSLFYKIESENGNLAGFFTLDMLNNGVVLSLFMLRPAFQQFNTEITEKINNFIISGDWQANLI